MEKAKQNATQQSQQQTIKAQQPVFENGLNDPDLVSIKIPELMVLLKW